MNLAYLRALELRVLIHGRRATLHPPGLTVMLRHNLNVDSFAYWHAGKRLTLQQAEALIRAAPDPFHPSNPHQVERVLTEG